VTKVTIIPDSVIDHRTLPTLSTFGEVFLLPHRIRLGDPASKLAIDVVQRVKSESVEVIAW
jgi:hypothetical protein